MSSAAELTEYVTNLRSLLALNEARFGIMVERQVQAIVLPKVQGTRAAIEAQLWDLLVLLLEGHKAYVPPLDDATYAKAHAAAGAGTKVSDGSAARFPRAATAVATALATLRECGVYPKPKLKSA